MRILYSQDSLQNNITQLDEVIIYGFPALGFNAGSTLQNLDSSLNSYPAESLSDLIRRNTSIYIRSYGNQMLSTISFRGTSAGHTSILWNGFNINSPTLGQFDFSQAPLIVMDELTVHYGGSSSLFGNESIGGTVLINSRGLWENKPSLFLYQDVGSYGSHNSRISIRTGTGQFESATRIYYSTLKNDFAYKNILKPDSPVEYQRNAGSSQKGISQDLYYLARPGKEVSFHTWYHSSSRKIQPSMANSESKDNQEDENLRLALKYRQQLSNGSFHSSIGIIQDFMLFNQAIRTFSRQSTIQSDLKKHINPHLSLDLGGSLNHIIVTTHNYQQKAEELRWDLFGWTKYRPAHSWVITGNIRSAGGSGFLAPLSPSMGLEFLINKNQSNTLRLKVQSAINYRIPTLNDRYWQPGGNPDLRPENSLSVESGFEFQHSGPTIEFSTDVTVYNIWVDNWIIWLPKSSFWSPVNLKEVVSQGIETRSVFHHHTGKHLLTLSSSYSFTRSTNKTQLDKYDRSKNKQLPYVPYHNYTLATDIKGQSWNFGLSSNFTGKRFTTSDNSSSLAGFWIVDLKAGKSFGNFSANAEILNLTNSTYFHLPLRPMPGRNYRISVSWNY